MNARRIGRWLVTEPNGEIPPLCSVPILGLTVLCLVIVIMSLIPWALFLAGVLLDAAITLLAMKFLTPAQQR